MVPNYLNPFKNSVVADGQKRYEWLQKVTRKYSKVVVSDFEIKRQKPTPSLLTVKHYAQKYDKIYFIIGSDNVQKLHRWHGFNDLDAQVEWIVATRKGFESKDYQTLEVEVDISSTDLRKNLTKEYIPKEILNEVKETYE